MKKFILPLVFAFLPLFSMAQNTVYISAGMSLPQKEESNFKDLYKNGTNLGAAFGLALSPNLELLLKLNMDSFNLDPNAFKVGTVVATTTGGNYNLLTPSAGFKLNVAPKGKINPYLVASVGYNLGKISPITAKAGTQTVTYDYDDQNALGINAGLGLTFNLNENAGIFVEPSYSMLFYKSSSSGTASFTKNQSFIPVKVGLAYHLMGK
jgi:opacity protein-like surface antigen